MTRQKDMCILICGHIAFLLSLLGPCKSLNEFFNSTFFSISSACRHSIHDIQHVTRAIYKCTAMLNFPEVNAH